MIIISKLEQTEGTVDDNGLAHMNIAIEILKLLFSEVDSKLALVHVFCFTFYNMNYSIKNYVQKNAYQI